MASLAAVADAERARPDETPVVDEVVALIPEDFPPQYQFDERGRPGGFAIEVMDGVARLAGLRVTYRSMPEWSQVVDALRRGEGDLIPNVGVTEERSISFDFTSPLETFSLGLFARTADTDVKGLGDLHGAAVAAVAGNEGANILRRYPEIRTRPYATGEQALFALLTGEVDAFVYPIPVVWKMARAGRIEDRIRQVGPPLLEVKRAIAVRKGEEALLQRLEAAVRRFIDSADYRRVYQRWYGRAEPYWTVQRVLIYGGGTATLMLALVVMGMSWWRLRAVLRLNRALAVREQERDQAQRALAELNAELERRVLERTRELATEVEQRRRIEAELRQAEEDYRTVADFAYDWETWEWPVGQYRYISPAFERIAGYPMREFLANGTLLETLIVPEDRDIWAGHRQAAIERSGLHRALFRIRRADGALRWIEHICQAVYGADGAYRGQRGNNRDVTERILMEQELACHRDRLEEQVRQRTAELEKAKDAAEAANRAKSAFLSSMSHELRTPLNAILGFAQLMQRDSGLTDEQRQGLGTIDRSGRHLLALINDVLEISRVEAGKLRLESVGFDLRESLASIAEMVAVPAKKKHLQLALTMADAVPRYVRGDEGKLRQVLVNLLSNAVKYTTVGSVGLTVAAERTGDGVRIDFRVADTGSGISAQDLERIFDAFVQTEVGERQGEGTGLGLAISRDYVLLMGGRLEVDSEPERGSTFRFSLRMEEITEEQVVGKQTQRRVVGLAAGQPAIRVLIAEDQEDNRLLLSKLLRSAGFEVREASGGEQAVSLFDAWHPALVWMDMRMPRMDGYEATRRIKATEAGRVAVVVALTASAFEEDRERVLAAGCDDFVRKPLNVDEVFSVMQRHLGLRYRYADESGIQDDIPELGEADLAGLPQALRERLLRAAVELDQEATAGVIEEIAARDAELAACLRRLLDDFRFDDLLRLSGAH